MLTSLLPGFREVRAPLAAGALLLATAYLLVSDQVASATASRATSPGFGRLSDSLGRSGWLIVAAVLAYLVGSALVTFRNMLNQRLLLGWLRHLSDETYVDGRHRKQTRWESVVAPISRTALSRVGRLGHESTIYDQRVAIGVGSDVILGGGKRLLIASKDLHNEVDRLQAESEFRDALVPPAAILGVVLAASLTMAFWLECIGIVLLVLLLVIMVFQARHMQREALSMHCHAVADGTVSTDFLDRWRLQHVERHEATPNTPPPSSGPDQ